MAQSTNEQWLDVMYAVQRFVRERLDKGALEELPKYMTEHQLAQNGQLYKLAQPEIRRAVELLVPGLVVDFLMNNRHRFSNLDATIGEFEGSKTTRRSDSRKRELDDPKTWEGIGDVSDNRNS